MAIARDFMVEPIKIDKDQSLVLALDLMEDNNLSCLAVVDTGEVIGLITIREILKRIWSERVRLTSLSSLYVTSVMIDNPITISPNMTVSEVASILIKHDLCGLPVVKNGSLIGLVTEESLLRACLRIDDSVDIILQHDYPKVKPEDKILYVRGLMIERNFPVLPVVKNGKIIGLISDVDVVKLIRLFYERVPEKYRRMRIRYLIVSDAMRRAPPKITLGTPVSKAAEFMINENSRGIIVVDFRGEFIGVLQLRDLIKNLI